MTTKIIRVTSGSPVLDLSQVEVGSTFRLANPNNEFMDAIFMKLRHISTGPRDDPSVRLNDGHIFHWGPLQRVILIDITIKYEDRIK